MALSLRCWRAIGRAEARQFARSEFVKSSVSVAGPQKRWTTSSGLGDSNSATEGEFWRMFVSVQHGIAPSRVLDILCTVVLSSSKAQLCLGSLTAGVTV